MELAKDLNLLSHFNVELINDIKKGFMDRWNYKFDCERAIDYLNAD